MCATVATKAYSARHCVHMPSSFLVRLRGYYTSVRYQQVDIERAQFNGSTATYGIVDCRRGDDGEKLMGWFSRHRFRSTYGTKRKWTLLQRFLSNISVELHIFVCNNPANIYIHLHITVLLASTSLYCASTNTCTTVVQHPHHLHGSVDKHPLLTQTIKCIYLLWFRKHSHLPLVERLCGYLCPFTVVP